MWQFAWYKIPQLAFPQLHALTLTLATRKDPNKEHYTQGKLHEIARIKKMSNAAEAQASLSELIELKPVSACLKSAERVLLELGCFA